MSKEERTVIAYIVACVSEFARSSGMDARQAFAYLNAHGGIDFLTEYYDTEHILSFEDVIEDLKAITQKSGGQLA